MSGGKSGDDRPQPDALYHLRTQDVAPAAQGPALLPGQLFAQRYLVEALVGEGGAGLVYRATDQLSRRTIALKLLRSGGAAEAVDRLVAEAMTARDIRHPNVVAVYDVGVHEGRPFIIMEHLAGRTLRNWMRERLQAESDLSFATAAGVIAAILDGLEAAHAQGIVHRDLKPENVFLLEEPGEGGARLKLLDFGLARLVGGAASGLTGATISGTPYYIAPEQISAPESVKPSADLYSLSVLFYELLVGVLPQGHWQPPSQGRSDIPPAIDKLIEAGLSNRPRLRPQSTADYRAAMKGEGPARASPQRQKGEDAAALLQAARKAYGDGGAYADGTLALILGEAAVEAGNTEALDLVDMWATEIDTNYEPGAELRKVEDPRDLITRTTQLQAASKRLHARGATSLAQFFWDHAFNVLSEAEEGGIAGAKEALESHYSDEFGKNFNPAHGASEEAVDDDETDEVEELDEGEEEEEPPSEKEGPEALRYRKLGEKAMTPDKNGVVPNWKEGFDNHHAAAILGDVPSMLVVARIFHEDEAFRRSQVVAWRWLARALDAGSRPAETMLAEWMSYFTPPGGVPAPKPFLSDFVNSWLDEAVRSFAAGRVNKSKYGKARASYLQAAEAGDARGMAGLAYMIQDDLGGWALPGEANKWLFRALAVNPRAACSELAKLFEIATDTSGGAP